MTRLLFVLAVLLLAQPLHAQQKDSTAQRGHRTFGIDCMHCHTTASWHDLKKDIDFDHRKTGYVLAGNHASVSCAGCHAGIPFSELKTDCASCHRDQHKGEFGNRCADCHTPAGWRAPNEAIARHQLTRFPLVGAHALADCQACHVNQDPHEFVNTPTECYACHRADYENAKQPDHLAGGFDTNCAACHDPGRGGWTGDFDHNTTEFPLRGAHAATPCTSCHVHGFSKLPKDCWACHETDYRAVISPNHADGQFPRDCESCHTLNAWQPARFDHSLTNFRLTGAHQRAVCQSCHVGGQFAGLPLQCQGCHQTDYDRTAQPNHQLLGFAPQCASCHNTEAWQPLEHMPGDIDHDKTRFPLLGGHRAVPCIDCHVGMRFAGTPTDCFVCHEQDYRATRNPDHAAGGFGQTCLDCHSMDGWKPATFDHATTKFPLEGAHATEPCESCHINGNYQLQYTDCWQCHETDFNQTLQPNHVSAQFEHDCTACHTTTAWKPATFDHARTKFPLEGAHAAEPCESCHINGNYQLQYSDCWQCHEADFNQAQQPNHVSAQFAHDCTTCHSTTAWRPSTFNHATTKFPLEGAHAAQPCESCHINGNYQLQYTDCWQCHETDFNQTLQPNHVSAQFTHDCTTCHNTTAWKPSTFDHATTKFPLEGAHAAQPCESCHINGNYQLTYTDCWQCHESDFTATLQPNHVSAQFGHDCTTCHSATAWKPSTFNHATTKFPLQGAHALQPCESCHINGNYQLQYTDCWQCHETDFGATTQPNHVSAQFGHDCTTCHNTTAWKPSTFDHASTKFPLAGAHAAQPCESCHINGNYQLTYTDCWQCHESDFTQVQQPNHVSAKFGHDCTSCHNTTAWRPATFDHASTKFPLAGAHAAQPCESCHINGNYQLTYTDCWQCHESDFTQALQPNHVSAQFGHDCTTCHGTTAWRPSTFDHAATNFPLQGAHATQPCQACHIGGNYQLSYVDCWQCHETDYNGTQSPSHAAGQFARDCTTCHGMAAWKPATFNHAATNFPLQGAHATQPCQACHVNGNYQLTYTDCWQCHETDYNATQNPSHVAGQFGRDCTTCHSLNAWRPATFDHATTNFPLQGAHTAQPCQACHVGGNYQLTYTACIQCHQSDYNSSVNPSHGTNQFPQDCTTCHTQNAWIPSTFSHGATAFPLTGAHQTQPCISCHVGGNYQLVYANCIQCHQSDYNTAANPPHAQNQFPQDCTTCHTTSAWQPSTFSHASTNFPLVGAHTAAACLDCHVNGNYSLTYTDCYQCHQSDYNGATSPANHQAMNLNHNCATCHTQTAWSPASPFRTAHNVNAPAGFPIYGSVRHKYQDEWNTCNECHTTNNTATFCCTSCHEHSSQSQVNNDHQGVSGYTYSCTSCANSGCHPNGREP